MRGFIIFLGIFSISWGIYYQMPYSARSVALAEANIFSLGDISAVAYNPAVLNDNRISFNITEWFINTRLGSILGSYKLKNNLILGGSLSYLSYGSFPVIDEFGNYQRQIGADMYRYQLALTSQFLSNKISLGIAFKGLTEKIDNKKTQKFQPQLGIIYQTKKIDFGGTVEFLSKLTGNLGFGINLPYNTVFFGTLAYQENLKVKLGLEYQFRKLAMRVGWSENSFTFGIGYTEGTYEFDYGMRNYNELGLVHSFSITIH
ncbi:MAG: hypothetical protein N2166_02920 [candidate division WOR-3 bacterium]|nr:hypothetical protein [candidate division WOR-3 bacterium]